MASNEDLVTDLLIHPVLLNKHTRALRKAGQRWAPVIEWGTLLVIMGLGFFVRLFAVIRHESVIHEFDPYFNFRTTRHLFSEGFYEFWNWFDSGSWYPLGRVIGQTLYPGLMTTAATVNIILSYTGVVIDIKDICVFLAPLFSGLTALAAHGFAKEASGSTGAGLFAAIFMVLCPAYMSRSVAGSYDNEAVAIFALVFAFYSIVRALNKCTMLSAMLAAIAYFYMVASWGGYVFITNVVAIYILALGFLGRLRLRHFVTYNVWYLFGTILCLNIPFVNFQAVTSSEHMVSHGTFLCVNAIFLSRYLKDLLPQESLDFLRRSIVAIALIGFSLLFLWLTVTGRTRWTGRSMTLLDPTYASKFIPIIASVSEHQPTVWSSYVFDLNLVLLFMPIGLWASFNRVRDADGLFFVGLYGVLAVYFSGVMVRLMLVLAPAACILSGIGLSYITSYFMENIRPRSPKKSEGLDSLTAEVQSETSGVSPSISVISLSILLYLTIQFVFHGVFCAAQAYSHPSIVINSRLQDGTRLIQDDFREAYYWFRHNTHPDARIMSWWDYGYQTCAMGNRTVIVDNNTWNNTHIATVGKIFASPEAKAYPMILKLDVDYVFVIFGGYIGYTSDDINKFLWMVRIASGVFPEIQERDYFSQKGHYTVGVDASQAMLDSLMYSLSYYRFNQTMKGYDRSRNYEIGKKNIKLKHLEEVYSTENWLVRIYKVKEPQNRGPVSTRRTF